MWAVMVESQTISRNGFQKVLSVEPAKNLAKLANKNKIKQ